MANMHGFTTQGVAPPGNFTQWREGFIGPNATAGGMWNTTIQPAVKEGLVTARPTPLHGHPPMATY